MFRSENNIIIITFHRYHIRSTSRYGSRQDFFEDILDKADENLIQDDLAKMRPKRNTHQRIRVEMEYKEYSSETRSELVMSPSSRDQELLGKFTEHFFELFSLFFFVLKAPPAGCSKAIQVLSLLLNWSRLGKLALQFFKIVHPFTNKIRDFCKISTKKRILMIWSVLFWIKIKI